MQAEQLHSTLIAQLPKEYHESIAFLLDETAYEKFVTVKEGFEQRDLSTAVANFELQHKIPLLYIFSEQVILDAFDELHITIKDSQEFHYGYVRAKYKGCDVCFVDTHAGLNPFTVWVDLTAPPQKIQTQINHVIAILNGQGWSNWELDPVLNTSFVGVEKRTSGTWDNFTINGTDKTILNHIPDENEIDFFNVTYECSFIAHEGNDPDIEVLLYKKDYSDQQFSIPFLLVYLLSHGLDIQSPADLKYDWNQGEKDCLWETAKAVYGGQRDQWIFFF